MKTYEPDRNGLMTLRILITLASAALIVLARVFIPWRLTVIILGAVIASTALFLMLIYLPVYFSSITYTVTDSEIIRKSGVLIKFRQSVRFSSIQYTTVVSTPFAQYTGFNFIIFFVYGGQFRLLFLSQKDAKEILDISRTFAGREV
ncbi:MAG: PH domain-containing protein [Ruminococcus sp.]|nr:PH domain-containing protein [Ruminococcus sp.]